MGRRKISFLIAATVILSAVFVAIYNRHLGTNSREDFITIVPSSGTLFENPSLGLKFEVPSGYRVLSTHSTPSTQQDDGFLLLYSAYDPWRETIALSWTTEGDRGLNPHATSLDDYETDYVSQEGSPRHGVRIHRTERVELNGSIALRQIYSTGFFDEAERLDSDTPFEERMNLRYVFFDERTFFTLRLVAGDANSSTSIIDMLANTVIFSKRGGESKATSTPGI